MKNTLKKTFTYLRTHLVRTLLIVIGVAIGITAVYQTYMYLNPYQRLDYKVFAPEGRTLEKPRLYITTQHSHLLGKDIDFLLFPKVSVNYFFTESGVRMLADVNKPTKKNMQYARKCSDLSNKPNVSSWFCEVKTSPKGQKYVHAGWVEHGGEKAAYFEWINLEKGGSFVSISNESFGHDTYKTTDWDSLVDSLEELKPSPETLPVVRRNVNPLN